LPAGLTLPSKIQAQVSVLMELVSVVLASVRWSVMVSAATWSVKPLGTR
jgi:hypothetical protein